MRQHNLPRIFINGIEIFDAIDHSYNLFRDYIDQPQLNVKLVFYNNNR
jgi:hypothetical protein